MQIPVGLRSPSAPSIPSAPYATHRPWAVYSLVGSLAPSNEPCKVPVQNRDFAMRLLERLHDPAGDDGDAPRQDLVHRGIDRMPQAHRVSGAKRHVASIG